MAMAVQKLYPEAKVTIGPWIENGFYYDFDMEPLTDRDLKRIKKEMDRIIARNLPLVREEVTRDEAQRRIMAVKEPYKMEILESIKEDPITIYHIGEEWWDLCAGPHVDSTGLINKKAVELESVAGAYWRGDENKPMLQRIYGTAWESEEQLKAYLYFKEEAKRRDHRRLGQYLDLFSIQDEAGGGLVFWHPKGAIVRHIIETLGRKYIWNMLEYCKEVSDQLRDNGIRTEVCHGERLPKLIRNAEKQKIPLMAVVGPKEVETQSVTVRSRFSGELGTMKIDEFLGRIKLAIEKRTSL
ncbi:hypothetical protein GH714_030953 [Hevea brasiliensis]|uniref:Threonyl/alanyl tRNA synthetase SAD domain-containing protein n=1 Tax=Hevea brasiliensis TaxID=3981 RepID=A0A6A6K7Q7_HEVBR|nr:hypothetical protein GH714_030953 [Hevea brasiliensis]